MSARDLRTTTAGTRGARVDIVVDGRPVEAYAGESVAAALLAAGIRTFRTTDRREASRSYYCGMGVCHDCLVTVDDVPYVRACQTPVRAGMRVERQGSLRVEEHA
jgi:predicted molibdopterin-dependent oxidoreductase YjgC